MNSLWFVVSKLPQGIYSRCGSLDSSIFAKYAFAHFCEQAMLFQRNTALSCSQSAHGVKSLPHILQGFCTVDGICGSLRNGLVHAVDHQIPEVGGTCTAAREGFRFKRMRKIVAAER